MLRRSAAFEKEGYFRRIARAKSHLSQVNKARRLAWAQTFKNWPVQEWMRVMNRPSILVILEEIFGLFATP